MTERPREDVSDKFCWWCSQCKTRKTIREGSFFKKSHITLRQWLLLLHLWAKNSPVTSAAEDLEVSRPTAIDAFQWLREVCTTTLLQSPIQLGGPGCVVQINESLFRHKPKVLICVVSSHLLAQALNVGTSAASQRKGYNTGAMGVWTGRCVTAASNWLYGARRDASTLLPIIQAHILPGTTIYSMNGQRTTKCRVYQTSLLIPQ